MTQAFDAFYDGSRIDNELNLAFAVNLESDTSLPAPHESQIIKNQSPLLDSTFTWVRHSMSQGKTTERWSATTDDHTSLVKGSVVVDVSLGVLTRDIWRLDSYERMKGHKKRYGNLPMLALTLRSRLLKYLSLD